MKNILFLPLIFVLGACSSSASESIYFINKIAEYNHETPKESYSMDERLKDQESAIFTYQKYKELSSELDDYLKVQQSTHTEKYRYISHSKILLGLTEDSSKSKALKKEFKEKVLDDFSEATRVYFNNYKIIPIDSMMCESYANEAFRLIDKYYKSTNRTYSERIDKAINKYKSCKNNELESIVTTISDRDAVSKQCLKYRKIVEDNPNDENLMEIRDKECSKNSVTSEEIMGVQ